MSKNITRTMETATVKAYVVIDHETVETVEVNTVGVENKRSAVAKAIATDFSERAEDIICFDFETIAVSERAFTMPVSTFISKAHVGKKPSARGWVTANKAQTTTKALVLTDNETLETVEMDTTGAETLGQVAKVFKNAGYNFLKVKDTEKTFTSYYMSERDFANLAESLAK